MESVDLKLLTLAAVLFVFRLIFKFVPVFPEKARARAADLCDAGVIASLVTLVLVSYVFQLSRVDGESMMPSLRDGEFTIVNKLVYRLHAPERGDIIVFESPIEEGRDYIKRVIALPGETVSVEEGWVRVNGLKLNEPYQMSPPLDFFPPYTVPAGYLFVMGDNRRNSTDSRNFRGIDIHRVLGKASFIIWPVSRWGFIQSFRGRRFKGG